MSAPWIMTRRITPWSPASRFTTGEASCAVRLWRWPLLVIHTCVEVEVDTAVKHAPATLIVTSLHLTGLPSSPPAAYVPLPKTTLSLCLHAPDTCAALPFMFTSFTMKMSSCYWECSCKPIATLLHNHWCHSTGLPSSPPTALLLWNSWPPQSSGSS